jgi:hypothetical protein
MSLFKQAYDGINRYKLFEVMNYYEVNKIGISNNGRGKAFVKVWNDLSDHFKVKKGLKQGDEIAHLLLNMALEYPIRQVLVDQLHYPSTYLVKLLVILLH